MWDELSCERPDRADPYEGLAWSEGQGPLAVASLPEVYPATREDVLTSPGSFATLRGSTVAEAHEMPLTQLQATVASPAPRPARSR